MASLTKKQNQEIRQYRRLFLRELSVRIYRSQDGGFCAEVTAFPGCVTEAGTFSELIEMVNDAVRTYHEVPARYLSYMPTYLPPLRAAQDVDLFPIRRVDEKVKLRLAVREGGSR